VIDENRNRAALTEQEERPRIRAKERQRPALAHHAFRGDQRQDVNDHARADDERDEAEVAAE
jgi:hypothetical protein